MATHHLVNPCGFNLHSRVVHWPRSPRTGHRWSKGLGHRTGRPNRWPGTDFPHLRIWQVSTNLHPRLDELHINWQKHWKKWYFTHLTILSLNVASQGLAKFYPAVPSPKHWRRVCPEIWPTSQHTHKFAVFLDSKNLCDTLPQNGVIEWASWNLVHSKAQWSNVYPLNSLLPNQRRQFFPRYATPG